MLFRLSCSWCTDSSYHIMFLGIHHPPTPTKKDPPSPPTQHMMAASNTCKNKQLSRARLELAALGYLLLSSSHTWWYETHVITNYTNETIQAMLELGWEELDGELEIWAVCITSKINVMDDIAMKMCSWIPGFPTTAVKERNNCQVALCDIFQYFMEKISTKRVIPGNA